MPELHFAIEKHSSSGMCDKTSVPPRTVTMDLLISVSVNILFCFLAFIWQKWGGGGGS